MVMKNAVSTQMPWLQAMWILRDGQQTAQQRSEARHLQQLRRGIHTNHRPQPLTPTAVKRQLWTTVRPPASLCSAASPSSPAASLSCCMWAWARSPSSSTRLTTLESAAAMATTGGRAPTTWPQPAAVTWSHGAGGARGRSSLGLVGGGPLLRRKADAGFQRSFRIILFPDFLLSRNPETLGAGVTSGHASPPIGAVHAPRWSDVRGRDWQRLAGGAAVCSPWLLLLYPVLQLWSVEPTGNFGRRTVSFGLVVRRLPNYNLQVRNGKPNGPLGAHPSLWEVIGHKGGELQT